MHKISLLSNLVCLLLLLASTSFSVGLAQDRHTVSGYITALSSGEALANAKVYVASVSKGALSNSYGFYSLTLPAGIHEVEFRYTGFPTVRKTLDLTTQDVGFNVELGFKDGEKSFDEVVVNGKKGDNVNSTKLGQIELDIEQIKRLPAFMGEVDVIKTIQLLPGVSSVSEGGQGFYVRGGGPD